MAGSVIFSHIFHCFIFICKIFVFSESEIARVNGEEYIKEVKWKPQI